MRLIDADKLQKAIPAEEDNITGMGMTYDEMEAYNDGIDEQWKKIVNAPTIESERPKGRWIEYIPEHGKCPFCGNQVDLLNGKANNFCGECGAYMRTKETDCDYERAVEQLEHDMLYEPTFNQDDGSM